MGTSRAEVLELFGVPTRVLPKRSVRRAPLSRSRDGDRRQPRARGRHGDDHLPRAVVMAASRRATSIAHAWRPTLRAIVEAFAEGDYDLARGIPCVAPVSRTSAEQIRTYITDYGETLARLPDAAWGSSCSQWMETHWDVLVDLWTIESGRSDMVLGARVFEVEDGFRIEVHAVYVP